MIAAGDETYKGRVLDLGPALDSVIEIEQLSTRHGRAERVTGEEDHVMRLDSGLGR